MRKMPLDVGTTGTASLGTYVVLNDEDCRPVDPLFEDPGAKFHMNHWITCPNRDQFRSKGQKS